MIRIAPILALTAVLAAPIPDAFAAELVPDAVVPSGQCIQLVDCAPAPAGIVFVSAPAGEGPAAAPEAPAVEGPVPDFVKEMEAKDAALTAAKAEAVSLGDRVKDLESAVSHYRNATDPAAKRLALWGALLALTLALLAATKHLAKLGDRGKRLLPWVAFGLAVLAGVLDGLVGGASLLNACLTATGPALAVVMHELREGWTGARTIAYAQERASRPAGK